MGVTNISMPRYLEVLAFESVNSAYYRLFSGNIIYIYQFGIIQTESDNTLILLKVALSISNKCSI